MDDLDLLRAYLDHQDQDAFAQLVRRHSPWLYSAARRQFGDAHLAEDATQAVFLLLSRRARTLRRYTYLAGWLFLTLGYCIRQMQRHRSRLERREQEAATMRPEKIEPEANWDEIAPLLEAVVGRLARQDRDAVLLRFYEQKPLAEVGRLLGVSEEAARKRVDRAVDKLRQNLAARGIEAQALSLSTLVLAHATEDGPAGLVETITTRVAQATGSSTAGGIAHGAGRMMALAKVKVAATWLIGLTAMISTAIVSSAIAGQQASRASTRPAVAGGSRGGGTNMVDETRECMHRMGVVNAAIMQYTYRHDMHLPPDLGATLPYLSRLATAPDEQPKPFTPQEQALQYLCPAESANVELPPAVTPEWINQHASYVYLGNADVSGNLSGSARIVVLHHKLTAGHTGRRGAMFLLSFLDGHGEGLDRNAAEQLIAQSRKALEAARGAPPEAGRGK